MALPVRVEHLLQAFLKDRFSPDSECCVTTQIRVVNLRLREGATHTCVSGI